VIFSWNFPIGTVNMSDEEPEDEITFDEAEDEDEDYEEMDMGSMLASFLATDDGDNVCTALVTIGNHLEKMSKLMDTQNKILLKMLSSLSKNN
jgi:hypothetical protein